MNKKPAPQTVGLRSLTMIGTTGLGTRSTPQRALKKRVFTDDEYAFLNTRSNEDLLNRIAQGDQLIQLIENPAIMNMVPNEAKATTSNLRFQQEAIRQILINRGHIF